MDWAWTIQQLEFSRLGAKGLVCGEEVLVLYHISGASGYFLSPLLSVLLFLDAHLATAQI